MPAYPRPDGRGPIEAVGIVGAAGCPSAIRDLTVAAPLKQLPGRQVAHTPFLTIRDLTVAAPLKRA